MSQRLDLEACYIPEPNSGCWIWTASVNENGYGRRWHDGREQKAHRVVYEATVGPIPEGLEPDHLCGVRCCVNPAHIELVTHRVNLQRSGARKRAATCGRGHRLSPPNLYLDKNGHRRCRQCVVDRATATGMEADYNAKRRARYMAKRA